ncbi:hypothetical protein PI125_g24544 [Phytophthora idaei]|nr:hypothetical protein PI125_g24544 [Phytophthora idaei]
MRETGPCRVVIPPPPQAVYPSPDLAEEALHQWTKDYGFNLSRRRVRYTDEEDRKVWARNYECGRTGCPKNTHHLTEETRTRTMRGSERSSCPMRIALHAVSKKDTDGPWKIVHTARSYHHNHEPSRDIRVHAAIRSRAARASREQACVTTSDLVELQTAAGVAVSTIQDTVLGADPNSLVLAKDIANTKSALRRRELASHTLIEALFQNLRQHNFFHKWRVNPETNELTHLIWATQPRPSFSSCITTYLLLTVPTKRTSIVFRSSTSLPSQGLTLCFPSRNVGFLERRKRTSSGRSTCYVTS